MTESFNRPGERIQPDAAEGNGSLQAEKRVNGRYVQRHLEPQNSELKASDDLKALQIPGKVSRYLPEGSEYINFDHLNFSFNYDLLSSEDVKLLVTDKEAESDIDEAGGITHWRKLNDLLLRDEKNHELRISELLPPDYQILFQVLGKIIRSSAGIEGYKVILVSGDLSSVNSILILLHEIGHVVDAARKNDPSQISNIYEKWFSDKKLTPVEIQELIRSERNAWAYALRKIKPFLRDSSHLNKYSVSELIHDYALRNYSDSAREKIEKGLVEELS